MEIAEKIAQILSTSVEEIWGDRQKLAEDIRRVTEEKEIKERENEQERYANTVYQEFQRRQSSCSSSSFSASVSLAEIVFASSSE